jgi:hypothetical protein
MKRCPENIRENVAQTGTVTGNQIYSVLFIMLNGKSYFKSEDDPTSLQKNALEFPTNSKNKISRSLRNRHAHGQRRQLHHL